MRYCPLCERDVQAVRKYPWVTIVIFFIIPLFFLLSLYLLFSTKEQCPICNYKWTKEDEKLSPTIMTFCTRCGAKNIGITNQCPKCGAALVYRERKN